MAQLSLGEATLLSTNLDPPSFLEMFLPRLPDFLGIFKVLLSNGSPGF